MASFNKVILLGNLTRDPELRYTQSGAAVCSLGIAVNRKYKVGEEMKEEVCFVDITVWGKAGESCDAFLAKGNSVLLEGRLNFRTWESQDGQKRSKLDVVAEKATFMPRGGASDNSGKREDGVLNSGSSKKKQGFDYSNQGNISDDEIPF
jgi:single-strand DNA-binding protein